MQSCRHGSLTPLIPTTLVEFILHPLSVELSLLYMARFTTIPWSESQTINETCPRCPLPANRHLVSEYLLELQVLLRGSPLID